MKEAFNYQSDVNFYDKKDFIIAVLRRKISSFKEYDAERKKTLCWTRTKNRRIRIHSK